jgi:hypothetical protein
MLHAWTGLPTRVCRTWRLASGMVTGTCGYCCRSAQRYRPIRAVNTYCSFHVVAAYG